MVKTAGGTVPQCRCAMDTISVDWQGQCAHCDSPCPNFPDCLQCIRGMEPDQIGEGITYAAEVIMWRAIDALSNQWWEQSEFNSRASKA